MAALRAAGVNPQKHVITWADSSNQGGRRRLSAIKEAPAYWPGP
jgi:hypothetical protein